MNWGMTALAVMAAGLAAGHASAADKPILAPPAAWVKPVPLPAASKPDVMAAHIILADQQVDLQPHAVTRYNENVVRIQTPQGLSGANVSFAWNPDTSTVTVHKLQIRRGDKIIDVLASQSFTVVRRETNLEAATLDGILTATIQPEGVQVGDVIDFAVSITDRDPALQSHVEMIGAGWNGMLVDLAHLRVQWPSAVAIRQRQTAGLPPLKIVHAGGLSSVEQTLPNLQPIIPPKGAPSRYAQLRLVELSDFVAWSDLAALMAPLYDKAAVLPPKSPLQAEIAAIAAQSGDPKRRAQAALALVQDRVRYVFLGMNDGGLVPADADTTWSRRFGDCKGKTVLLIALLKALGITARPVIVNAQMGDGLDQHLPMVALFNHVLVRAIIGGRTYWLDGTRQGDADIDAIRTPDFRWGLPLVPGATLIAMDQPPLDKPQVETVIRIDATGGLSLPAPVHIEKIWRDDLAVVFNQRLTNLTPGLRDSGLKSYWREQFNFVDPVTVGATFDPVTREERFVVDGTARMDWNNGWYESDGVGVGYKPDFSRDPGPDHDAPFAVAYPSFTRTQETMLLPPGAFPLDHADAVDTTVAGVAYHRAATLTGNRFFVEETDRSVAREFPAAEAAAAATTLRALSDRTVYIGKPANYRLTDQELDSALAAAPASESALIDLGNELINHMRYGEAVKTLTRAIALNPKSALAIADRAVAYQHEGDEALARADADAAIAIDPHNAVALRAQGLLAEASGAVKDAAAAYAASLRSEPANVFALSRLARIDYGAGHWDEALDYAAQAIARNPGEIELYLLRASIFRNQGKTDDALREAGAVVAANPDSAFAHVAAARIYAKLGRTDQAMAEIDRALKIAPDSYVYINRADIRPKADIVGRTADLQAALQADPKSLAAMYAAAELREERQDYAGAVTAWSTALARKPDDGEVLVRRGVDYLRSGQSALADKDFATARAQPPPQMLNRFCWIKATAGVALESALAECEAALAKLPDNAAFLDSRGLTLLRLGRLDDAMAAYDKALAQSPRLAASLFGRAVVEARKGETAKAEADTAAALAIYPDIRDEFAAYGVTMPASPARPANNASH